MVLGLLQEILNAIGDSNELFSFNHVVSFHKKAGHLPIPEDRQMPQLAIWMRFRTESRRPQFLWG